MPDKWNHPEGALELLEGNVQIQQTRSKKHVTLWTRKTTAEGAGKPIVKQIFTECAKETRNEPSVEVRHKIMSDCMKQHKEEMGTPGIRVRESRGKFSEEVNGRPGLKGTFLAKDTTNPKDEGTRINEADARLVRSGQTIDALPGPNDLINEFSVDAVPAKETKQDETEVDPEVKALLCEYEDPLNRYQAAVENKQFGDAVMIEEEMLAKSDCEVCHAIIGQVTEAAEAMDGCEGDNCAKLLAEFRSTIEWAKGAFCPEHERKA